jgi:hypothetical protein
MAEGEEGRKKYDWWSGVAVAMGVSGVTDPSLRSGRTDEMNKTDAAPQDLLGTISAVEFEGSAEGPSGLLLIYDDGRRIIVAPTGYETDGLSLRFETLAP